MGPTYYKTDKNEISSRMMMMMMMMMIMMMMIYRPKFTVQTPKASKRYQTLYTGDIQVLGAPSSAKTKTGYTTTLTSWMTSWAPKTVRCSLLASVPYCNYHRIGTAVWRWWSPPGSIWSNQACDFGVEHSRSTRSCPEGLQESCKTQLSWLVVWHH